MPDSSIPPEKPKRPRYHLATQIPPKYRSLNMATEVNKTPVPMKQRDAIRVGVLDLCR